MRAICAAIAILFLAAACHSTTVDVQDEAPAIEESALPAFVAERQCDQQIACDCYLETGPVGEDPAEYTRNKCIENRMLELTHWQGRMRENGLIYDSHCAARKLATMQAWGCADSTDVAEMSLGCANHCRVYHGEVPANRECNPSIDDCAQGLVCQRERYDDQVTGEPRYRCKSTCLLEGMTCVEEGACGPGLFCDYAHTDPNPVCEPLPTVGAECVNQSCAASSYCNEDDVCAAMLEDGAACDFTVPCRGTCIDNVCEQGTALVCDWDLRNAF